jgi:ribonuclease Z
MPLKLTILGSGSAVPNLQRGVSAHYLNINERRILIDCGEGTQLQLRRFKVKFQRLQYIFISHLHGDHYLGLVGLFSSMSLLGRESKLIIFAPEGLEEIIQLQFKTSGVYLNYKIEFVVLTATEKTLIFEDNSIEVYTFPLKHRITTFGFLFQEKPRGKSVDKDKIGEFNLTLPEILMVKRGEDVVRGEQVIKNEELALPDEKLCSYAYCSDTKFIPELSEIVKNVSLLYHEGTFLTEDKDKAKSTMHSTALEAATIASEANVDQLLIGHFSARYNDTKAHLKEAQQIFQNVCCVEDGDEFVVE